MFKFKFVLGKFNSVNARGPTIQNSLRAKWLTRLAPHDLKIAFAPNENQTPMYDAEQVNIVDKHEAGWWNHYFFQKDILGTNDAGFSLGPNIDLKKSIERQVPLIASSVFHKNVLVQHYNYNPEKIFVIPTILDTELFSPGKKSKTIKVGWVGYDVDHRRRVKGPEVLPYLAQRFPDLQFEMVFNVEPKFQNEWLPKELPNLKILYSVPHYLMPNIMRQWHVLVCGSKSESGATTVKEAMACGVPIIAAKVGVLPEVASTQILLDEMKLSHPPEVYYQYAWSRESLERFAQALENLLSNSQKYQVQVKEAIKESNKFDPYTISQKWFKFMYYCRDHSPFWKG